MNGTGRTAVLDDATVNKIAAGEVRAGKKSASGRYSYRLMRQPSPSELKKRLR